MSEPQLVGIVGSVLMVLVGLVGWIGTRIFAKLDRLSDQQSDMQSGLQRQINEGDNVLHHRVNELDRRVTRVETRCSMEHDGTAKS